MSSDARPRPIVILGPTAGGKSELAVRLAERLRSLGEPSGGGEVLGADSMQVYRHLDAGTAKPEPELRARVPHHLIDIVEPTERFTVHDWLARAEPLIESLQARGVTPIVVGGTNLYLKALLEGMFDGPGQDEAFRAELEKVSGTVLHERLRAVDPAAAGRIHPNDRKRTIRALEVHHLTGQPISQLQRQWREEPRDPHVRAYRHNPILVGLDWPTERINRRINQRVKQMFFPDAGPERSEGPDRLRGSESPESLPAETARLDAAGLLGPQAREALGYKQVLQALRGEITMDEAFERTKIETRRFARQQRTWLKRFRGVHWLPAADHDAESLAGKCLREVLS